ISHSSVVSTSRILVVQLLCSLDIECITDIRFVCMLFTIAIIFLCAPLFLCELFHCCVVFFFFQAEDGIRDATVTGVQTCALPISGSVARQRFHGWLHRQIVECTQNKFREFGGTVRFVSPRNTSSEAFDGSGPVEIGRASCRERLLVVVVVV